MLSRLLLAFALLATVCSSACALDLVSQHDAGKSVAPNRGLLYRVTRAGQTAYLFGTIHVGKQGAMPLAPEVAQALLSSHSLVIELDIRQSAPFQQALARYGSYAPGDTVQQHLSAPALGQLVQALARAGLSLQSMQHYKPWLLANMLVSVELDRHGFQRADAVEYVLLDAANQQAKSVRELESADYQLGLFETMDERQQEQYMLENLAELADGASLKKSQALVDAWDSADAQRITAAWQELTSGDTVSAAFMQRTLLGKRNPEMASTIERILQQDQVAFVGVGLLHLVGEQGLPQLLRQRGYQVEQLY